MKWTVLQLFAATAYVAVFTLAFMHPFSYWPHLSIVAWFVVLIYVIVGSYENEDALRTRVSRTITTTMLAYLIVAMAPDFIYTNCLPHVWFAQWWSVMRESEITAAILSAQGAGPNMASVGYLAPITRVVSLLNASLAFGLIAGVVAARRSTRRARNAINTPVQTNSP